MRSCCAKKLSMSSSSWCPPLRPPPGLNESGSSFASNLREGENLVLRMMVHTAMMAATQLATTMMAMNAGRDMPPTVASSSSLDAAAEAEAEADELDSVALSESSESVEVLVLRTFELAAPDETRALVVGALLAESEEVVEALVGADEDVGELDEDEVVGVVRTAVSLEADDVLDVEAVDDVSSLDDGSRMPETTAPACEVAALIAPPKSPPSVPAVLSLAASDAVAAAVSVA